MGRSDAALPFCIAVELYRTEGGCSSSFTKL
jgi:hypothetical protein